MINKEELLNKVTKYRIPHFHRQLPIILFWSQKSGCTSLVKWVYFQIGLLEKALQYDWMVHPYDIKEYKLNINHQKDMKEHILHSKKDTYKLVRNPYRRAVSAFLMLYNKQDPYWRKALVDIRKDLFNDRNSTKGLSFKEFLLYIKKMGSHVGSINGHFMDGHFAQQYVEGEEHFVNQCIYLENFAQQISEIEHKYGLIKSNPQKLSVSVHNHASSMIHKGNYAEMNIHDPSFPRFPTYESFYNKQTKRLVEEVYRKDFEMYGYKMNL